VNGTLGSTHFTTSGGIIKHESDIRRTDHLEVTMPAGNLRDVLRLAMRAHLHAGKDLSEDDDRTFRH
jgi:hypothetical protein